MRLTTRAKLSCTRSNINHTCENRLKRKNYKTAIQISLHFLHLESNCSWLLHNIAHFRCSVCTPTLAVIIIFHILAVIAIAEVYFQEGNKECNEKEFSNAVHFFTEGIKVNCKDSVKNAKMYSNRAEAYFQLGSMFLLLLLSFTLLC